MHKYESIKTIDTATFDYRSEELHGIVK